MLGNFHNPDILSCLANLSSDEVFTPPSIANQILDSLPKELWSDKSVTFLDPVSKSGVFLREITKRLLNGLEDEIPDIEQRLEHILKNQVYGIGITKLTAEISRRSLYCSKKANGDYSIVNFNDEEGNLRYFESDHFFANGVSCKYCGVSKKLYKRDKGLESYAYAFIHEDKPEELFNMKFDVIIGNPPYQMMDGGAKSSASPVYQKFVEAAIKLNPTYLTMIIPGRWFSGGKGLDQFRDKMLNDKSIKEIHDFQIGEECFPGIRIAGGVCYFLRDKNYSGDCEFFSYKNHKVVSSMKRPLLEEGSSSLIRINEAISILRKVKAQHEDTFSSIVSPRKPFGFATDFLKDQKKYNLPEIHDKEIKNGYSILGSLNYKRTRKYFSADYPIPRNKEAITKYKVFVSMSLDNGFDWSKERLKPFVGYPGEVVTENFLMVGPFDNENDANNVKNYMDTKFFHLLLFLKKVSQHVTSKVYEYIPMQDFSEVWTDKKLYKKYNLDQKEIEFIESSIKSI